MQRREDGTGVIKQRMGDAMADRLIASAESGTFGSSVAGYAIHQTFGRDMDKGRISIESSAVLCLWL